VLGRYSVRRDTKVELAAAIAAARLGPRIRQLGEWNATQPAKRAGGGLYLRLRKRMLGGKERG